MAAKKGVHEGDVNPSEEVGIGSPVGDGFAFRVLISALDPLVHGVDAIRFSRHGGSGGEGGHGEPADGARQATEGFILVAGVLHHPSEAAGMKGLHKKSTDASDEGGHITMGDPRGFIGEIEAGAIAGGDISEPRRDAIGVASQ